ncbi:NAD(P)-dependent oxidoreductase [Alicyclobacillus acidoterrestris]|nr:NAD(P)-dependent oxidoreductase [Alicyclobacillus acidoterrestris]EPZ42908.1 hypothetical protein N007_13980 [Alicyclobacillus acidoterrestris ATCC 49025]
MWRLQQYPYGLGASEISVYHDASGTEVYVMIVGYMGFGEAARAITAGLREAGVEDIVAYDAFRNESLEDRARQIGVALQDGPEGVGRQADIVFSLVTPSSALDVARSAAPYLRTNAVYADLNSCSPKVKRDIAQVLANTGVRFTCVAVMSAVPPLRHKVPMLADGPGAAPLKQAMDPYGMQIDVIDGAIGSAAAIKMCRSVIVKGMEALFLEALLAADAAGVADEVLASADASFGHMTVSELANYLVVRNMQHGERRAHELREAAETVAELGYDPLVTEGAAKRLEWSAQRQKASDGVAQVPASYKAALDILRQSSDNTD